MEENNSNHEEISKNSISRIVFPPRILFKKFPILHEQYEKYPEHDFVDEFYLKDEVTEYINELKNSNKPIPSFISYGIEIIDKGTEIINHEKCEFVITKQEYNSTYDPINFVVQPDIDSPKYTVITKLIKYIDPIANCLAKIYVDYRLQDPVEENYKEINLKYIENNLLYIYKLLIINGISKIKRDSKNYQKLEERFEDIKLIYKNQGGMDLESKFRKIKLALENPFQTDDEPYTVKLVFEYFDEQKNGRYKLRNIDRKYFCVQFDHYFKNTSGTETYNYLKELDILDYDMSKKYNTFISNFKNIKSGKAYPKGDEKWKPDDKIIKEIDALVQLALKLKKFIE